MKTVIAYLQSLQWEWTEMTVEHILKIIYYYIDLGLESVSTISTLNHYEQNT